MKRFVFAALAALMLLPATASAQGGPLVDVVRFQGYVTTTVRDAIDVPVGQVYLVWNVTTAQFEYADENDVWTALGANVAWSDPVDANIVPDVASTRNIGSAANPFLNGYFDDVDLTDRLTVAGELILDGAAAYMTLTPTTTAGPVAEGNVYADDTANRLKFHDGTSYKNVLIEGDATDDQIALQVPITDAGAYWASGNVEALSQEIGADLAALSADILEDNNITLPSSTIRYVDIPASSDFVFRLGGLTDVFTIDGAGGMTFGTYTPTVPTNPYGAGWNGSLAVANEDAVYDEMELKVENTISGRTSVTAVTEIGTQTMANYLSDGAPSAGQWVGISDATPEYLTTSATFNFALLDEYNYDDSAIDAATITFSNMGEGHKVRIKYNRASAPTYSGETPTQLPSTYSAGAWPASVNVEAVYYKRFGTVYYFFKEL